MTTPPRRRLAEELVRVRKRAGLTGRDMARHLGVSQAQLYRYDKGVTVPTLPTVRKWLDRCRAADAESLDDAGRARIVELAEQAHETPRTWKAMQDAGVRSTQDLAAQQDEDAVEEWCAEFVVMPGLVQTPEYAAAAVARADLHNQFDHPEQVAGRLARQTRLFEQGRRWRFLISERLLSWSPGSAALLEPQRDRLASLAATDGVEVAVLPESAVVEPSGLWWVPFTVIVPRDGQRYVVVESVEGEREIRAPDEVASYELLWERMWAAAVKGKEAVALIRG